ncbi:MAG: citramalate synthase, partial [Alphaproteobacteria bacterium]|nr:citramalate synthase [Alphaproteobacteria bacterium]
MAERIYLYDSTLRDGAQTQGVDFTVADKIAIATALDQLGIDYVEGGWPGANPTDDAFFATKPPLARARFTAFGMTRRPGRSAANDPGLSALLNSGAGALCLVGKTWDFHVDAALGIPRGENVDMIGESIAHVVERQREVLFDAEHFFDGYKANPSYALDCLKAARDAGARWIVLCDTNGGTLPSEVERIVGAVTAHVPGDRIGIHCHNDTENAVANSLAAVRAGARQIQGTLNGLGERCGNANLIALLPSLMLKLGYETGVSHDQLRQLTHVSRLVDERLNRTPNRHAAYVGEAAFAHKGGLHVSAIEKDPRTYEHVAPESVGNFRHVVVSDQAGRSNILNRFRDIGLSLEPDSKRVGELVELVKAREFEGYAYDGAEASFELLARRLIEDVPEYFRVQAFRVIDERRWNARGALVTLLEATIRVEVGNEKLMTVAEGNGPVNALDTALRKALLPAYPSLEEVQLVDYKVRILTPNEGTKAVT